jgi:hypothetical protein
MTDPDALHDLEERIALIQEGSRHPDGSPMAIDEVRRDVLSGEIKPTEVRK